MSCNFMTTLTQFSSKSAPLWRRFIALIVSVLCLSQLLSAPAFAQMPSAFDDPFVDEPQFCAMVTTTQQRIKGDVFSPGGCCRTYREHLEQGTRQNMLNRIHKKVCRTDLQVHVF